MAHRIPGQQGKETGLGSLLIYNCWQRRYKHAQPCNGSIPVETMETVDSVDMTLCNKTLSISPVAGVSLAFLKIQFEPIWHKGLEIRL